MSDDLIAAIEAQLAAVQPQVTVKPLVWEEVTDWRECTKLEAPALGGAYFVADLDRDSGVYSVGIDLGGLAFVMLLEPDKEFGGRKPRKFHTIEAAQAAAQADYEYRILSALDMQPAVQPDPLGAEWMRMRALEASEASPDWEAGIAENLMAVANRIRGIPAPTDDDLDRAALARPKVAALVEAAEAQVKLHRVLHPHGYAAEKTDADLRAALAALKGGAA